MYYVVLFTERLTAQTKTAAITNNRIGKPRSSGLTWCLGKGDGELEKIRGCADDGFKLTVGKAVAYSGTPPWLLSNAVAVPGWTLLEGAAVGAPEPADVCGLWVLAWLVALPLPAVIDNAITVLL
jgi:hypothetical protein